MILISDIDKLEELVWQDNTSANEDMINNDLKEMIRHLQDLYTILDKHDEDIHVFYQAILGDAINLISSIDFVKLKR